MALHNFVRSIQERDDKQIKAIVDYQDDSGQTPDLKPREYTVDPPIPATLLAKVRADMAEIQSHYVDQGGLKALYQLEGTEILPADDGPPDDPVPDPLRDAWLVKVAQLRQAQILSPDHPFRVTLQAEVDSLFLPAYVGAEPK